MLMTFRQTLQLCKPAKEISTVISLDLQYNAKKKKRKKPQARKQAMKVRQFTKRRY